MMALIGGLVMAVGSSFGKFLKVEYAGLVKLVLPPLMIAVGVGWLLSPRILMSSSLLSARNWRAVRGNDLPGQCVYQALLLAVVLLVFVNTLIYGEDSFDQAEVGAGHSGKSGRVVFRFSFACLIVATLWAVEITCGIFGLSGHSHEWIALVVFAVFALMDFNLYRSIKLHLKFISDNDFGSSVEVQIKQSELSLKAQNFLAQLLFVDIPVVLGIAVVLGLLNLFLDRSPALGVPGDRSAEAYLRGLATGAVVMHMAASQAIFFLIYLRYHIQRFRLMN